MFINIKSKVNFLLLVLFSVLSSYSDSLAVPAAPILHTMSQPDGMTIQARQWGDENISGWETEDGYSIVFDEAINRWTYAVHGVDGSLASSLMVVGIDGPPDVRPMIRPVNQAVYKKMLTRETRVMDNQLQYSPAGISEPQGVVPPTGTGNIPVILINFNNTTTITTPAQFDTLLFGYGNNSMRDYYNEVSYGAFTVSAGPGGVAGWYTAANGHNYYGYANGFQRAAMLAKEAVTQADAVYDFAPYDQDGDCYVDVANIVHQGTGTEASGNTTDIWSHRWSFASAGVGEYTTNDACTAGGYIKVNDYVIQPELLWGQIHTVGVFAHEYGHALGLPDLYDTDGSSEGIGNWSLMAGGSWNMLIGGRQGDRPAHMDAWSKYFLGWVTPTQVTGTLVSESIQQAATNADVYQIRIGAPLSGEYFLVENRQKAEFDAGLPGAGLLIWHIDGATISSRMNSNTVNDNECYPGGPSCTLQHYGVRLVQADNLWELEKGIDRGDTGDPYPGVTNNTSFTAASTPNSNLYNGIPSGVSIATISASGATMTATLSLSTITSTLTVASSNPNSGVSITVGPYDNNGQGSGRTQFTRVYNNSTLVTLTAPLTASGNNFSSWTGCNSTSGTTCYVTMDAAKTVTAIFNLPNVTITLVPDSASVPRGGTLGYTVTGKNNTTTTQTFQYWTYVTLPDASRYPSSGELYGPVTVTLTAGQTVSAHLTHGIPTNAPLGTYVYYGNVGIYPATLWNAVGFNFNVTAIATATSSGTRENGLSK